jgi:hypothetical protein
MHMPADYPRINQFPEWFTVDDDTRYLVTTGDGETEHTGAALHAGLELSVLAATPDASIAPIQITVAPRR